MPKKFTGCTLILLVATILHSIQDLMHFCHFPCSGLKQPKLKCLSTQDLLKRMPFHYCYLLPHSEFTTRQITKEIPHGFHFFFFMYNAVSDNKNYLFVILSLSLIYSNLLPFVPFRSKCLEAKFMVFARPIYSCITEWKKSTYSLNHRQ